MAFGGRIRKQDERAGAIKKLRKWAIYDRQQLETTPEEDRAAPKPLSSSQKAREYCTQKCLLGLLNGDVLDPKCPNITLHRGVVHALTHHPVNHVRWLDLLRIQLQESLDEGLMPLGLEGATGALFKTTLLAYGYTFVSKGTTNACIKRLQNEAAVYKQLRPLQGRHVPVFLGAIDLRSMKKTYYYSHRVRVVHMTFLSWGGNMMTDAAQVGGTEISLKDKALRSLRAVHNQGVVHEDVRFPNLLFNPEVDEVMIIDFERSSILKLIQPHLSRLVLSSQERKRRLRQKRNVGFSRDIWDLQTVFREHCM